MRAALPKCTGCGTLLTRGRKQYGHVVAGWSVEDDKGKARGVTDPTFTGRVLCDLCFKALRPPEARGKLRTKCDDCGAPVRYRQIATAWTRLPACSGLYGARYSALALCPACWQRRISGEQLELFPDA